MRKVVVIGLDGATWDVIGPLIKRNKLPNFKKIVNSGSYGELESTIPPVTGPAWLSMATGKNPGKTGIFGFLNKERGSFSGRVINSNDFRKNNPYWDILNKKGYKTFILNHPMLYPFYDVNGIIVGGMGFPANSGITYPNSLESELNNISNGYWTSISRTSTKYFDKNGKYNKDKFLRDILILIEKQFKVVEYLIEQDWDFFLHITSASDFLQHAMWRDWVHTDSEYHDRFVEVWRTLDEKIGLILEKNSDANFLIVSDHGFGPLEESFNINKWLYEKGLMKKHRFSRVRKAMYSILSFMYRKIKPTLLGRYLQLDRKVLNIRLKSLNINLPNIPPEIDVEKSKVIPGYSSGMMGFLHINVPKQNYREIKENVIEELKKTGREYKIDIKIYEPKNLYIGDKVDLAPDIMFKINNFRCTIRRSTLEGEVYSNKSPFEYESGIHRREGIFIAYGPDIEKRKKITGAKIYDLAPTILHMFGLPIPSDMDGRVLKDIFKEGSEPAQREVRYQAGDVEREKVKGMIRKLKKSGKL